MRINRQVFFTAVRVSLFRGSLEQEQVDGMNVLLDYFEQHQYNLHYFAYELGTTLHETARTMQPIHERGKVSYFDKYEPDTRKGMELGNINKGDGFRYRGRGFVQLTGRANYAKASKELGVDFVTDPDRALEPRLAAAIMHRGMVEGWFTGRRLAQFFNDEKTDWVEARRIVNGTDQAVDIGVYAKTFYQALVQAKEDSPPIKIIPPVRPPVLDAVPAAPKTKKVSRPWTWYVLAAIAASGAVGYIISHMR